MIADITKFPNFLRARECLRAAGLTLQQGGFDVRAKYRISTSGGDERYCNTLREVEAIAAEMAANGIHALKSSMAAHVGPPCFPCRQAGQPQTQ